MKKIKFSNKTHNLNPLRIPSALILLVPPGSVFLEAVKAICNPDIWHKNFFVLSNHKCINSNTDSWICLLNLIFNVRNSKKRMARFFEKLKSLMRFQKQGEILLKWSMKEEDTTDKLGLTEKRSKSGLSFICIGGERKRPRRLPAPSLSLTQFSSLYLLSMLLSLFFLWNLFILSFSLISTFLEFLEGIRFRVEINVISRSCAKALNDRSNNKFGVKFD